ncbi:MAG: hypothetical protein R3C69_18150 [Geminicoccaceae bacterium]
MPLGLADAATASRALTSIAELVIRIASCRRRPRATGAARPDSGGSFCVLGLGKPARASSASAPDLDLVFLFEGPDDQRCRTAPSPCPSRLHYARLSPASASSAPSPGRPRLPSRSTPRLRPSGNVGPIARSLGNFRRYQETTAQVRERQSLTCARAVAGDLGLVADATAAIDEALAALAEPELLARVRSALMRLRTKEHGSDSPWNLKHCRAASSISSSRPKYLVLRHGPDHPSSRRTDTGGILEAAIEAGLIEAAVGRQPLQALAFRRRCRPSSASP